MRTLALALLILPSVAWAEPDGSNPIAAEPIVSTEVEPVEEPAEVRHWANLRIGGAVGAGTGRPEVCGEFAPLSFLSVEACGTGAGILHGEPVDEASHYRIKLALLRLRAGPFLLEPIVGAGLIELQLGEDDPGFVFGGVGPRGVETAGFEAMGALRGLLPIGSGFELVGEFSLGMGYTPHAPDLVRPQPMTPVFASLTVGTGF